MVPSQVVLDIEDAYVRWADEIFCRGSGLAECPCVEVQQSLWTQAGWNVTQIFKDRAFNGTAKSIQQCLTASGQSILLEEASVLTLIKQLEQDYKCSGICETLPFLMFSDIRL